MPDTNQPIIVIKRIKKVAAGHHGGAWKVAFADFVTAMMAFFLLMWLIGTTEPAERAGIADFFQNPSGIQGPGGASTSMIENGGNKDASAWDAPKTPQSNKPDAAPKASASPAQTAHAIAEEIAEKQERHALASLLEELKAAMQTGQPLEPFKDQLLLDLTSEGLRIQIVDKENRPMFASGSSSLQEYTQLILGEITQTIAQLPNRISISGHTDTTPFASDHGYSNWELSADRANAARRELIAAGLDEQKIGRVVGLSSSVLFDKANPQNPINRRISIVIMNRATERELAENERAQNQPTAPTSRFPLLLPPPIIKTPEVPAR